MVVNGLSLLFKRQSLGKIVVSMKLKVFLIVSLCYFNRKMMNIFIDLFVLVRILELGYASIKYFVLRKFERVIYVMDDLERTKDIRLRVNGNFKNLLTEKDDNHTLSQSILKRYEAG